MAVRRQWEAEAELRFLNRPEPISLSWSSTSRPVAPSVLTISRGLPGSPAPGSMHGNIFDLADAFEGLPRRQLVVLGQPGAGKSVVATLLTLGLLKRREAGHPVPVLLGLSSWNPHAEDLRTWMARRLAEDYPGLNSTRTYGRTASTQLVIDGYLLPILDGLDEIPAELHASAIDAIDRAVAGDWPFVLTCRADEYQAAVTSGGHVLAAAAVVEIEPVAAQDAIAYLSYGLPAGDTRWNAVSEALHHDTSAPVAIALSTPLMVWLARTAYTAPGADPGELTDVTHFPAPAAIEDRLLDAYLPAIYPSQPPRLDASLTTRYTAVQARRWLTFVACHLRNQNLPDLAWWQMHHAVSQVRIGAMLGLAGGLAVGLLTALISGIRWGLAAGLVMAVCLIALRGGSSRNLDDPRPRRALWQPRKSATHLLLALIGALMVVAACGLFDLIVRLAKITLRTPMSVMYLDLLGFLIILVVAALTHSLLTPADSIDATSPDAVLRRDRAAGLVLGLGLGAAFGIAFAVWEGISAGLLLGSALGSAFWLGATSWPSFVAARVWLVTDGSVPWRLMAFLHDAHRRGALRQTSGRYQFRHARQQNRLIATANAAGSRAAGPAPPAQKSEPPENAGG